MLIIFDIDGTLADPFKRLPLILKQFPKDWDGFFSRVKEDLPIIKIVHMCKSLMKYHTVLFVTGRSSVCAEDTEQWLRLHLGIQEGYAVELYMRSEQDRRQDYVVKRELLHEIAAIYGKFPDLAFEDRQQVVDMYREQGIRVCQVDKGDF